MYTERQMRLEIARLLPQLLWNRVKHGRFLDILVTHSPPYGIHDQEDRAHTGFRQFLTLMRFFRPRYLLHGHIHVYRHKPSRISQYEATTVINVYPHHLLQVEI
jgi:Icc-related predicted phosphoesterase